MYKNSQEKITPDYGGKVFVDKINFNSTKTCLISSRIKTALYKNPGVFQEVTPPLHVFMENYFRVVSKIVFMH